MKQFTRGILLFAITFYCTLFTTVQAQQTVHLNFPTIEAEIGYNVCLPMTVAQFTQISSLQIPVKWNPYHFGYPTVQNELLSNTIVSVDSEKGELRYIWEDATLENPASFDDGTALFELCFDVIGGKGADSPVEISELMLPLFEPLFIDFDFNELPYEVENGVVEIQDDCDGDAILPSSICENSEFVISVDLVASGLSISNVGYWKIDGVIVEESAEMSNFPTSNGNIYIDQVNSIFDDDYKEELYLTFLDTEEHTLQYFYDFINCVDSTEVFTLRANPQPEDVNLEVPSHVCYGENLLLDLEIEQEGDFELSFSIDGKDSVKIVNSANDSLLFEGLENNLQLNFFNLVNDSTFCSSSDIEPNDTLITVYEELTLMLVDSICNDDGSFEATYEILGGSGDIELVTNSNGELSGNTYQTNVLLAEEKDTVLIVDNFCQSTSITFIPQVQCSCIDEVTEFDLDVQIACSTGEIKPSVKKAFVSGSANPVTFFQVYSKDNTGGIDEILFDTIVFTEDKPLIPYSDKFENGKTYYAVPYLAERVNGEIDLDYRCLIFGEEIRFRYYRNPEPQVIGDDMVCQNQNDIKYEVSTSQSGNDFVWTVESGDVEGLQQGNNLFVDVKSGSSFSISVEESYKPKDLANEDLECLGDDDLDVTITSQVAPELVNIILFPGGFLTAEGSDDLCYQWIKTSKLTGEVVEEGPMEKNWVVGNELDTVNFVYTCITSLPVNGECVLSTCATFNYFNSNGPTSVEDYRYSDIKLYPNPFHSEIIIESNQFSGKESIRIYDSLGQELGVKRTDSGSKILLDLTNYHQGMYFISIFDEAGKLQTSYRILKK